MEECDRVSLSVYNISPVNGPAQGICGHSVPIGDKVIVPYFAYLKVLLKQGQTAAMVGMYVREDKQIDLPAAP